MTTNVDPTIPAALPNPALAARGIPGSADQLPVIAIDLPVMYEDEGQSEMGESEPHTLTDAILYMALRTHLKARPEYRAFSNLNLYYHSVDHWAYVSPDVMIVRPTQPLPERPASYRIGTHGPTPALAIEILSRRSAQQQDLTLKPIIYAYIGVAEYILIDGTGEFLEQRLLLRRLQADGGWLDEQDKDGGVTSRLGFRIVLEGDGYPRVMETATGRRYLRPDEAEESVDKARSTANAEAEARRQAEGRANAEAEARRRAEEEANALRAELDRLRGDRPK